MPKRFVDPALSGSLRLVFLIFLIWQIGIPAHAQTQVQRGLDPKGTLDRGPAARMASAQSPLDSKRVLILHDLEFNVPILVATNRGLMEVLESGGISIRNQFYENLDFGRNPESEHRKKVAELLRQRYSNRQVDLIVTTYAGALKFALNEGLTIFPQAPIIALYLAPGIEISESNRVIFRHSTAVDPSSSLESALKLLPKTKQVYVVSGAHINDKRLENLVRQEFKKWEGRLEFFYLSDLPMEKILATVSSLPANSIVFLPSFQTDVLGTVFTTREVVRRVSQTSNAPVFGLVDVGLGSGFVGGYLFSYELMGRKAGELGLEILRSGIQNTAGPPKNIEVRPIPMYDARQLKRWGLNASTLPEGSIVINKAVTLWDFRYYIIGALIFCLGETALIIFLIVQRRRKKTAQESMRKAEEKYRDIFDGALEGIFETSPQGQVLTANPAIARMLGYDLPDDFTSPIRDAANQIWVNPDARADFVRLIEKQNAVFKYECQLWRKDRTKIWVSLSARRVSGPDGKTISYSGFIEDITDRKRAEDEVAGARAELLRVERSLRLNEMTASLAHELNQPLAAILNNAQAALNFLKADKPDLNEFQEILRDIISDDQRAGNVIRSLRSMMKREVGEKKPIILNDVVNDVIQIFRSEAIFRNVRMETELDGFSLLVLGDKTQLQQVILNIVMNAAEAMSQNQPERRKLILRTQRKGQSIWMTARDFGPGIDQENLERVFQPFFTTKGTGLGMGLAVCSSIIKDHRGRIWAENNPDGGATFFIELPIHQSGK